MEINFFNETKKLKEEIGKDIAASFEEIENRQIKEILMQRQLTSRYIKGITSYYLHRGLGGKFSHNKLINLATAIEIYSTSMVLIDNLIDKHTKRNGRTTCLKEYGPEMTGLASLYASNVGLLRLSPYLQNFFKITGINGYDAVGKAITGAVAMDIEHPTKPNQILEEITKVNGITLGFPLGLVASTAINDKMKIFGIIRYGIDTGIAFGLYEEIRDFFGEHGKGEASEMKSGRIPYFIADLISVDPKFKCSDYIGRNATSYRLKKLLKKKKVLEKTKNLIKNHLNYGKNNLQRNLRENEFLILDSLRITIEDSLEKLI